MDLHETRKEQGVEVANREHAKGAGEWQQVGPAGLGEVGRPGPVAILGGPFAHVQTRSVLLQ